MTRPMSDADLNPYATLKAAPSRTDWGTLILHWVTAIAVFTSLATGLRLAADAEDAVISRWFAPILPQGEIWSVHMYAGLTLFFSITAYVLYLRRAGLMRRVALKRTRVLVLPTATKLRWGAVNLILHWLVYGLIVALTITGIALYLGFGGWVVTVHLASAFGCLLYTLAHVVAHFLFGGWDQVLRVFRPAQLVATRITRANPLRYALLAGLAMAGLLTFSDWWTRQTLAVVATSKPPKLDGRLDDAVWQGAEPVTVRTQQGLGLGGSGESTVEFRAAHDEDNIYFAFRWQDPSRSLRRHPLIKREDGWHMLTRRGDVADEMDYYEDKFSIVFSESPAFGGGGSTHMGPKPLADKPGPLNGRGAHYTTDGSLVDMWQWQSSRGGMLGMINDEYFGAPEEPNADQIAGKKRYKSGNGDDPGKGFYSYTYKAQPPGGYRGTVEVVRLPRDVARMEAARGPWNPDPDAIDDGQWWMFEADTVEYSPEADAAIPVGTVIPGVIIAGQYEGDRGDVRAMGRWEDGWWTMEASRKLSTGSAYDQDFAVDRPIYTWVAVFDHNQTRHTRHMRPVRLEFR